MDWLLCLGIALVMLAGAVLGARRFSRRRSRLPLATPINLLFAGVLCSSLILILPVYARLTEGTFRHLETLLLSLHATFQIFTLDADRGIILESIACTDPALTGLYTGLLSLLFVLGPLLTFAFLISFIRNISANLRLLRAYFSEIFAFSELNEQTLALAEDLHRNHPKAVILFAGTGEEKENGSDLADSAGDLGAIRMKKEITGIPFLRHSPRKPVTLFAAGEEETRNIHQALKLMETYADAENMTLIVVSSRIEGELLMNGANEGKLRVRRVNPVRSLVYEQLEEEGRKLFESAIQEPETAEKTISAVIVGLGQHGMEMLRALSWYCQMDGYRLRIHGFDQDELKEDRLEAQYPELIANTEYDILIHSGMTAGTATFEQEIRKIGAISYMLVALGSDEANIGAATELRKLCERMGTHPRIQAIVYSPEAREVLTRITNYRGQPYGIDYIGDTRSVWSEKVILHSALEQEALRLHRKWGEEAEFWRYEYNSRSSMASAIHRKARISCGIPGAEKAEQELTEEEKDRIERLEHRRWNAYMRSEGYVWSGSPEKSSRNDLGKMHHDLIPFERLSEKEKRKDSTVGTL